ncbi:hypothetical protein H0H92_003980 [Tricholoma furcatifolium]|nr:hypothetical protein H0H92_003980 [Tricholoma furcatifolium]
MSLHDDTLDLFDEDAVLAEIKSSFAHTTDASAEPYKALFRRHADIALITSFSDFLIHTANTNIAHLDAVLGATLDIINDDSLPSVSWTTPNPTATFNDVFKIDFRDKVHDLLRMADRDRFLAMSVLSGRCIALGVLVSPSTLGAIGEGLMLPDEASDNYPDEVNEWRALGSCLQLLGCFSWLLRELSDRFSVQRVVNALQSLKFAEKDRFIVETTLAHVESNPKEDLSSEEIAKLINDSQRSFA